MSRTYLSPFGRYLPVRDDNEPFGPDHLTEDTDPSMTTYQLPPPTLPARLQFGADLAPGFTEPNRYDTTGHARRLHESQRSTYDEQTRRPYHEPLPSVSQLLTPGSQSSIPASPFSPQHSPDPSEVGSTHHSSGRNALSDRSAQAGFVYQGGYEPLSSQSQSRDNMIDPRTNDYHIIPSANQYPPPYPNNHMAYPPPYTSYPESIRPASHVNQPRQIAPLTAPIQSYQNPVISYELPPSSPSDHGSNGRDAANVVKPLPRVIGERVIPGEGPCWIYEDGSTCKKVIDGEAVNAQWGITKAGKPRKRLAIACTTCREKKIKCDPGDPKCVQCEKYGRECRFTTAHRGQHTSPDSPSYDDQACTTSIIPRDDRPPHPTRKSNPELNGLVETTVRDPREPPTDAEVTEATSVARPAPATGRSAVKRRRPNAADTSTKSIPRKTAPDESRRPQSSGLDATVSWEALSGYANDVHSFSWAHDPYEVDPEITMHYIDTYFIHINAATYRIFPRKRFTRWIQTEKAKSPDDLMVVYTILAMGSIFSSRAERKHEGSLFSKIARYAVEKNHGNFSLQLIQSRLLLAFYHFALGETHKAWDFGGMGFRVASALKLNLEEGVTDIGDDDRMEYGLNRHALAECRRRTFWSAYMMDRFSGFCSAHLCAIHDEDTFVRLPCREEVFDCQEPVRTPYFDNELTDQRLCQDTVPSELGPMAYYVQISSIWGDVLANIYRSPHQSIHRYSADHEAFHITTHQRLASWKASLPDYLSYSPLNAKASVNHGYVGTFISLHTIYHATIIKLNRHVRHAHLSAASLTRAVRAATHHAVKVLEIMQTLSNVERHKVFTSTPSQAHQQQLKIPFSTPFAGYAMLIATDVLSAAGSLDPDALTNTFRIMNGCLKVIEELSQFWASARAQRKVIRKRVEQLAESATGEAAAGKTVWIARTALDKTFGRDQDVLYNDAVQQPAWRARFLEDLGLAARDDEILLFGGESRAGGWWE